MAAHHAKNPHHRIGARKNRDGAHAFAPLAIGRYKALIGIGYFLPQIIKGIGLSVLETGFVTAIPAIVGAIGMVTVGWFSDRAADRRWACGIAMMVAAAGVAGMALTGSTWWVLLPTCVMAFSLEASRPLFWALPSLFLSRTAAATGIALINSIGNLGGIIGPVVVGWVKDATQSSAGGLYFVRGMSRRRELPRGRNRGWASATTASRPRR